MRNVAAASCNAIGTTLARKVVGLLQVMSLLRPGEHRRSQHSTVIESRDAPADASQSPAAQRRTPARSGNGNRGEFDYADRWSSHTVAVANDAKPRSSLSPKLARLVPPANGAGIHFADRAVIPGPDQDS